MNISRIRQMAVQGDMSTDALRYLLECHGECEHLDYKIDIDLGTDHGCVSFAKDVVAIKNVGGGYIIIGVEDKTWKPTGLKSRLVYDTKLLREKVIKTTGLDVEIDIVQHELYVDGGSPLFAMILIRAAAKRSKLRVPSIIGKDFHPQEKWGIRQGDIFARSGDTTKKISTDIELQGLLDDLEARYQEQDIEQANAIPSPFAIESGLYRILPREYEKFIGRSGFKDNLRK